MNAFVGIWIFVAAVAQMGACSEVNVTVFYESLCRDSINFITKQLYPTHLVLKDHMKVEFVPFGKARIIPRPWHIMCQHGYRECMGNAMQACALNRYSDLDQQMEIVNCFMSDSDPPTAADRCEKKAGIDGEVVKKCATGDAGRELLKENEDRTRRFRERLRFVPTILFNDKYTEQDQREALSDLKSVVCRKLGESAPEECN